MGARRDQPRPRSGSKLAKCSRSSPNSRANRATRGTDRATNRHDLFHRSSRPDQAKIARDILARHPRVGVSVRVFGSRAEGTPQPYSDLVLRLGGKDRLPTALPADLAEASSERDLPFEVAVSSWQFLEPSFREAIDRDGIEFG